MQKYSARHLTQTESHPALGDEQLRTQLDKIGLQVSERARGQLGAPGIGAGACLSDYVLYVYRPVIILHSLPGVHFHVDAV
jgi:hypothetical protein